MAYSDLVSRNMIHRLHHLDRENNRAICDACGEIDVVWKSAGKARPRFATCGQAYRLDKIIQKNKNGDSEIARNNVAKARLRLQYLEEQALSQPRPPRGKAANQ